MHSACLGLYSHLAPAAMVILATLAYRVVQHFHRSEHLPGWSSTHWYRLSSPPPLSHSYSWLSNFVSGCPAQHVPLSHICSAARAKLQAGCSTTHVEYTKVKKGCFRTFATSTSSRHSQPLRTLLWYMSCTKMSI